MPACIYPVTTIFTTSKAVLKWLGTVLLLVTTIPLTVMFTVAVSYPMLADPLALILSVFPSLGISWGIFKTSVSAIISKELERDPPGGAIGALGETKVTKLAFVMLLSAVSCFCFILFKDVRTFTRVKPSSAGESANSGKSCFKRNNPKFRVQGLGVRAVRASRQIQVNPRLKPCDLAT
jgi:hypothetical protein